MKRCFTIPQTSTLANSCVPPTIVTHPQSQQLDDGDSVTFTVVATGTNLVYQWRLNGLNIVGATSATLVIPYVDAADAGTYTVIVSNDCGSVTSLNALLVVNPSTDIIITPGDTTHTFGPLRLLIVIVLDPAADMAAVRIGLTPNGEEIMIEQPVIAAVNDPNGQPFALSVNRYFPVPATIYFTGITSLTTITIYKE